jgi:hypothetical protein
MESQHTAAQIAEWMLEELQREGTLYQETAVHDIQEKFGKRFTYLNANGNPAIGKDVLKEFKRLSEDSAVWEREDLCWCLRKPSDRPGRQQGY